MVIESAKIYWVGCDQGNLATYNSFALGVVSNEVKSIRLETILRLVNNNVVVFKSITRVTDALAEDCSPEERNAASRSSLADHIPKRV
jgi:CO/xanthine dehydrogenase FAD-binding subunit